VALPPGWKYEPAHGIDSFVGSFVGEGMRLEFDYGAYWLGLPTDTTGYEVRLVWVDGRAAHAYIARSAPADLTALYVSDLWDPAPPYFGTARLSLVGVDLTSSQQDLALAIFATLRFRRQIPAAGRWEVVSELPGAIPVDLDMVSESEGWIAGGAFDGSASVGFIDRRQGNLSSRREFSGTTTIGSLDVQGRDRWAVAWGSRQVLRWPADDPAGWRVSLADAPGPVFDVQAFGNEVWAVGLPGISHFDGQTWTSAETTGGGVDVDVVDRRSGWIAGGREAWRLVDGSWQLDTSPRPNDVFLRMVDAVSPHEAWFGAGADTGGLVRWRDGEWTLVPGSVVSGLDMLSPAEGWATATRAEGGCLFLRFHDGEWTPDPSPCEGKLYAVQVQRDGSAWAVGYRGTPQTGLTGLLYRYVAEAPTATATATQMTPRTTTTPTTPTATPTEAVATSTGTVSPAATPLTTPTPGPRATPDGAGAVLLPLLYRSGGAR
jgi:hypothetical protein